MSKKSFVTAINCMDGRAQIPVIEYLKKERKVEFVDMITEPGPNRILAEKKDHSAVMSIKKRVEISAMKHGSKVIAIVAHHDCAGNPVDKEKQIAHIRDAIKTIRGWGFQMEIVGLWVDENWKVNEVE